jgi:hypothetical protein
MKYRLWGLMAACLWANAVYSCEETGAPLYVNLQLKSQDTLVSWPMLKGYINNNVVCITQETIKPQLAALPVLDAVIQPITDVMFEINEKQGVEVTWQLAIDGAAEITQLLVEKSSYQAACALQHLTFISALATVNGRGGYSAMSSEAKASEDCKDANVIQVTKEKNAQWQLSASFFMLDKHDVIEPKIVDVEKKAEVDLGDKMKSFLNAKPASDDAKKRMKKR